MSNSNQLSNLDYCYMDL